MIKKYSFLFLLFLVSLQGYTQDFTKIKTGFKGVMDPVMAWIIPNEGKSKAFLAGDYFVDNNKFIISQLNQYHSVNLFKTVSTPFPALYQGDAAVADYNNDGLPDVVITGLNRYGVPVVNLYKNMGHNHFIQVPGPFKGLSNGTIEWGDYDHDGDMDILTTGKNIKNQLETIIYKNNNGKFSIIYPDIPGVYYGCARWGDVNGNGWLDILIMGNNGKGPFTALFINDKGKYHKFFESFVPLSNGDAVWADFDGDGDLDFFITGENTDGYPQCLIYSNETMSNYFKPVSVSVRPLKNGTVDVGDFDKDGDADLLITGESLERPYTLVYENKMTFDFKNINAGLPGVANGNALWGDYDHDGDMDILLSGIDVCYKFHGDIFKNNLNPPKGKKETGTSIFINAPTPLYNMGPYYYYVFSSCFCDPTGGDNLSYNMYISNVHLLKKKYQLNYKFNDILIKTVPNWTRVDRGHRTSNGFLTKKEAEKSRKQVIESYKVTGFKVHFINW